MTDPGPARGDALSELAARARAALAGDIPDPAEGDGPFTGTAADGLVVAQVAADGTVHSVAIDPEAFKRPLEDVAAAARTAINAALDARPGQVDFGPVIATVRAAQTEARQNMTAITQGMADVERSIRATRERIR